MDDTVSAVDMETVLLEPTNLPLGPGTDENNDNLHATDDLTAPDMDSDIIPLQDTTNGGASEEKSEVKDNEDEKGNEDGDEDNEDNDDDKSDDGNKPLEERVKNSGKGLDQYTKYIRLMEERMASMESKFQKLESDSEAVIKAAEKLQKESSSDHDSVFPELRYVGWIDFKIRICEGSKAPAIEVLDGPARYWYHWRQDRYAPWWATDSAPVEKNQSKPGNTYELPERIRINSKPLRAILAHICSEDVPSSPYVLLRPYKLLVHFDAEIRAFFETLKTRWPDDNASGDSPDNTVAVASETDPNLSGDGSEKEPTSTVKSEKQEEKAKPQKKEKPTTEEIMHSREARRDMQYLIQFMDEHIVPVVQRFSNGSCTKVHFHDLWFIFRQGDMLYCPMRLEKGKTKNTVPVRYQTACKLYHITGGQPKLWSDRPYDTQPRLKDRLSKLEIYGYYIEYDGTHYGPISMNISIDPYEGEREITSLEAFPLRYLETKRRETIEQGLLNQGNIFIEATKHKHWFFSGSTFGSNPNGSEYSRDTEAVVESEVVIDFTAAPAYAYQNVLGRVSYMESITDPYEWPEYPRDGYEITVWKNRDKKEKKNSCLECSEETIFHDFIIDSLQATKWTREDVFVRAVSLRHEQETAQNTIAEQILTDEERMLLPRRSVGYALRDREWGRFDLKCLRKIEKDDVPLKELSLPKGYKEMITAQVESYSLPEVTEKAEMSGYGHDVVRGKGKGLIILLHGVPGVGKTSTAESIALKTGKPLFPITCGDLGTRPEEVEASLRHMFRLAQLWGCILLLDEADVFLAQRHRHELKHNGVVSGMFLTA